MKGAKIAPPPTWVINSVGKWGSILGFSRPTPDFWGLWRGQGQDLKNNGGNFWDSEGLKHGVFLKFYLLKSPPKMRIFWGQDSFNFWDL